MLTKSKCGSNISREEPVRTLSPQLNQKEGYYLGEFSKRGIKLMEAACYDRGKDRNCECFVYMCELFGSFFFGTDYMKFSRFNLI